ncbi:hypothetical protein A2U01_0082919 [Trifolium medium]|uniref:Uncharacterized protein n=1 Tax=Trifolium medium TaxID=97028 RepID=A0A392TL12_9FABA|nr:hypothetical protein [Trifolium medium]
MLRYAQFMLWEGFWFRSLAQRAARAGATRSALVLRQFFLLASAQRAARAGAARRVALYFLILFWSWRGARR